jgi:hypothetical protein
MGLYPQGVSTQTMSRAIGLTSLAYFKSVTVAPAWAQRDVAHGIESFL